MKIEFRQAEWPIEARDPEAFAAKANVSVAVARDALAHVLSSVPYLSTCGRYQVAVRTVEPLPGAPPLIHLSIKRCDREPIHDWRELQAIKNALVGEEHEAVELYPAESRVVDTANQYHLWVLANTDYRWPVGFQRRVIGTAEEAEAVGAKQRPMEKDHDG